MQAVVLVIDDDPSLLATLGEALTTDDTAPILATAADALREIKRGHEAVPTWRTARTCSMLRRM